ncbi:class I SAM-dependent methyltransferase [Fulvivirgaceae bacterium BMA10]|uniref:Class I SAM-dependent methyltransferase n=1 Tax=Splendidivirga corallicola TaxID=3051826 RepID=A0ABT8L0L1_9BACT|nr:class I SAM-dependent methyltransferase [Fulvivirgaceae bacterium BMA10]
MTEILGTIGYAEVVQKYAKATKSIAFEVLHRDFLDFIPNNKGLILDVGAGIGRDAYVLAKKGHKVIAVEPLKEFRIEGSRTYKLTNVKWVDDSLPTLNQLNKYENKFDFVLASGVWHHLDEVEQVHAMSKISYLLKPKGTFALSLRNGPAGMGTHIFSIDVQKTIKNAESCNLTSRMVLKNQPSLMKNKENVKWSRLVFQKL